MAILKTVSIPLILARILGQALSNEVIWPRQSLSRDIHPIPGPGSGGPYPKYDCEISPPIETQRHQAGLAIDG
ncbi:hypothetical protein BDR05DRAFT_969181 [Suillus weaverae]|nr:hypothetical protein BDR05DRAFT_969181 [Suillus weaverae]